MDTTGQKTIDHLTRCRRVARLILSNDASSLGLHPAVYFYRWTGKQQPILFLTWTTIVIRLEQRKWLMEFIKLRSKVENFLIDNRPLVNQVIRKFGTKHSGTTHLAEFYVDIMQFFGDGGDARNILSLFKNKPNYRYLQPDESPYDGVSPTKFSTQVKSGLVVQTLLPLAPRCPICGGLVPSQAISVDHKVRKEDGGESVIENAQVTHPYCNTGFKETLAREQRTQA
jgi:HNH endonuclease